MMMLACERPMNSLARRIMPLERANAARSADVGEVIAVRSRGSRPPRARRARPSPRLSSDASSPNTKHDTVLIAMETAMMRCVLKRCSMYPVTGLISVRPRYCRPAMAREGAA